MRAPRLAALGRRLRDFAALGAFARLGPCASRLESGAFGRYDIGAPGRTTKGILTTRHKKLLGWRPSLVG